MKSIYFLSIFLLTVFTSLAQNTTEPVGDYARVKIFANAQGLQWLAQNGVTIDHGITKEGVFFISDFSAAEIQTIASLNFVYEVLIADIEAYYAQILSDNSPSQTNRNAACVGGGGAPNAYVNPTVPTHFNLGTMGGYLTYSEMLAELDEMLSAFPGLITAKAQISNFVTHENRPIYFVRISDNANVDEGEPKILYSAIHHAREPMSLMETIFYMWFVLENYGTNDEVTYLVNNTQMYFVPCINPDGYVYNQTTNPNGGGMWRKNRRNNGGGVYGVDLNRNYSYGWGTTGTSTTTSNDTYCGPSAFSEPETQAMRWLVQNNHFITAFNAHTYGNDILFPIGTTTAEFAPHHNWFQEESNHQVQYNGYVAMKSSGLYPASGDSDDYMYKVDIGVNQKDTMFVHTPEIGTAFWQPSNEIIPTCQEMLFPNLVLAHLSRVYTVVSDADPNMIANINGVFNHTAKRLGRQSGPVTVSIQPLQNIVSVGAPIVYNLNQQQSQNGTISYALNPNIQFGDQIIYILKTDNGLWVRKDTIVKTFGALTVQVTENATATTNWTGNWSTTASTYVSATKSFTDSPVGNYANNANKTCTFVPTVDLTNASSAMVRFYAKWNLEADYDYVQFQVSTDGGTNWIAQCGNYTVNGTNANGSVQPNNQPVYEGVQSNWVFEEISLSDYLGQIIKFRFKLGSDGGTVADGYYFDDFEVLYNLQTPPVNPIAGFTVNNGSLCQGNTIQFNDASTNAPTSWAWNFGDGTQSTQQNPSHAFANAGWYVVSLTANNAAGSDVFTDSVEVLTTPAVLLTSSDVDNLVCLNQGNVALTVNPVNANVSGVGVNGLNFDPAVAGIGSFNLIATVADPNGCVGQDTLSFSVQNCAGIETTSVNQGMVYPNPFNTMLILEGFEIGSKIQVLDLNGKAVIQMVVSSNKMGMNTERLSGGTYLLECLGQGQVRRQIVIKE